MGHEGQNYLRIMASTDALAAYPPLNLPPHALHTEVRSGRILALCLVRRKWVVLTPEEWVRQRLLAHLSTDLGYPLSLIRMERAVKGSERSQRADAVIHGRDGRPLMLIECKSADESIDEETLFQAARYNRLIGAPYLLLSNGIQHFCCKVAEHGLNFLDHLPLHSALTSVLK